MRSFTEPPNSPAHNQLKRPLRCSLQKHNCATMVGKVKCCCFRRPRSRATIPSRWLKTPGKILAKFAFELLGIGHTSLSAFSHRCSKYSPCIFAIAAKVKNSANLFFLYGPKPQTVHDPITCNSLRKAMTQHTFLFLAFLHSSNNGRALGAM